MRKNKIVISFLILILTWFAGIASAQASDPSALIQSIANNMIAGLKSNKATLKTKPSIVYNLAYKYVVPHASLSEMSKRVLPPAVWNKATPAQRAQFEKAFTTTVIRTYASALTNYEDQTVKVFPVRGGASGGTVEVSSQIIGSRNSPINVTYRLVRAGGDWKLYDMSVEGVSMLSSFRSQFADILSQGDMSTLLSRLSGHNAR